MIEEQQAPVILYDGKCNFCNAIINFVIRNDKKKIFRFAPLQSKEARALLREGNECFVSLQTVYLLNKGKAQKRSSAVFGIFRLLGFPYSTLSIFRFLPVYITDGVYKFIAKNRYKWFGMTDEVVKPDDKVKERFIC